MIRGWLGVSVEPTPLFNDDGKALPALSVVAVAANSPAARAGLEAGDVITHINGEPVRDGRTTMHSIARLRPGDTVEVSVRRERQSLELRATVGVLAQSTGAAPVR